MAEMQSDELILVDPDNHILGYEGKRKCHDGEGLLHRAFSIFTFDDQKRLLLQKRSIYKRLWPDYWSNTCCSHPRRGMDEKAEAMRRLKTEFGFTTELRFLFTFQYSARYGEVGSEREICSVFIGKQNDTISPDPREISDWKFISIESLNLCLMRSPEKFTPWFHIEWKEIRKNYLGDIESFI